MTNPNEPREKLLALAFFLQGHAFGIVAALVALNPKPAPSGFLYAGTALIVLSLVIVFSTPGPRK